MIEYDRMTMTSHMNAFISQLLAFAGSLPEAASRMYIIQETIIAMVSMVHINVVAARMMSCTKSQTDVGSQASLTDFLIHSVSYMLNLHCQFSRHFGQIVIQFTVLSSGIAVFWAYVFRHRLPINNINMNQIFFMNKIIW